VLSLVTSCACWFSRIFLQGILIFKGLIARRLCMSFGVKGLITMCVWGMCSSGPGQCSGAGCCEHDDELSDSEAVE
jgi:hypothetical protein